MKLSSRVKYYNKYIVCILLTALVSITCSKTDRVNQLKVSNPKDIIDTTDIKVIDGDTIKIGDRKIRLYGMDAPEIKQECRKARKKWLCGETAKDRLINIIGDSKDLICNKKYNDLYKREVAMCYKGEKDIGQIMVREGMAIAYRQYSKKYVPDEEYAKLNKLGIWSSKFIEPRIYRLQKKNKRKKNL